MEACNVNIAVALTVLISRSLGDTLSLRYCDIVIAFHLDETFCGTISSYYVNIYYINQYAVIYLLHENKVNKKISTFSDSMCSYSSKRSGSLPNTHFIHFLTPQLEHAAYRQEKNSDYNITQTLSLQNTNVSHVNVITYKIMNIYLLKWCTVTLHEILSLKETM